MSVCGNFTNQKFLTKTLENRFHYISKVNLSLLVDLIFSPKYDVKCEQSQDSVLMLKVFHICSLIKTHSIKIWLFIQNNRLQI